MLVTGAMGTRVFQDAKTGQRKTLTREDLVARTRFELVISALRGKLGVSLAGSQSDFPQLRGPAWDSMGPAGTGQNPLRNPLYKSHASDTGFRR